MIYIFYNRIFVLFSQIRICVISGTLVSRSAMMNAWKYKMAVEGHLGAHGGFEFERDLAVTTVGMSREPINAWLPLYVSKPHWNRVKVSMTAFVVQPFTRQII